MLEQSLCMIGSPLCLTPSTAPAPSPLPASRDLVLVQFSQVVHVRNSPDQLTQASESSPQQQRTNSSIQEPIDQYNTHAKRPGGHSCSVVPQARVVSRFGLRPASLRCHSKRDLAIPVSIASQALGGPSDQLTKHLGAPHSKTYEMTVEVTLSRAPWPAARAPFGSRLSIVHRRGLGGCEISVEMKFHESS